MENIPKIHLVLIIHTSYAKHKNMIKNSFGLGDILPKRVLGFLTKER